MKSLTLEAKEVYPQEIESLLLKIDIVADANVIKIIIHYLMNILLQNYHYQKKKKTILKILTKLETFVRKCS